MFFANKSTQILCKRLIFKCEVFVRFDRLVEYGMHDFLVNPIKVVLGFFSTSLK